jgi:hypothetical protein
VTGIPLQDANHTIVKERIYLDKSDLNLLHDEIDNALTRPWTVIKDYRRTQTSQPIWWYETVCAENSVHVMIGNEIYFLSADGHLMRYAFERYVPTPRKSWKSEDARMGLFDAVALALTFFQRASGSDGRLPRREPSSTLLIGQNSQNVVYGSSRLLQALDPRPLEQVNKMGTKPADAAAT